MLSYMSLGNVKADISGEILIIGYLKAFISAEFTKVPQAVKNLGAVEDKRNTQKSSKNHKQRI